MVGKLTPDSQLSASRIAVAMNASPYATQNELLDEFLQRDAGTYVDQYVESDPAYLGNLMEGTMIEECARRLDLVDVETEITVPYQHKDLPLAASLDGRGKGTRLIKANPDRKIFLPQGGTIETAGKVGIIESKLTSAPPSEKPRWYRGPLQLQAQLMCYPHARWGAIVTLYQSVHLYIYVYRRDPVVQMQIREAVLDFERRRKERDYYPAYSPGDAAIAYSSMDLSLPMVDIDPDTEEAGALEQLVLAQRNRANAEEDIEDATTTLMEAIGEAPGAVGLVGNKMVQVKWPTRNYKAQPEKVTPAKPARTIRAKTLTIKEMD